MKTLTATLLASQKKAIRTPYVEAKVYDYEAGIKRLTWTRLYTGAEPDSHHGIAFDGQGSMHRIRAASGDKLYYQKITDPGPSSDYSNWSLVTGDCSGPCAIAAYGAKVYIFYRHNELNQLYKLYSHDYGVSWQNAQLVAYSEVASLAACWWGTGNNVVCLAIKSSFPAKLNGIVLNTSDQSTSQHEWSDTNHPLLETYGIGATYNPFWPAIEIVFAGKESDSPYNHFDLFRTKFSDTYNFLALESFLMTPDGENVTYQYPDCHLPSPLTGEGQGEGEGEGVIHAILAGRYTDGVTPSRCRGLGRAEDGSRIVQDGFDWDLLKLAIDELEQVYDPNLQTADSAQDRADAILRTQQTLQTQGTVNIPTNCGQELLDVVEVTDARCGIDQENYRVQGIRTLYDRRKAQYDQALSLGAP
jgi:hypothetical protein